MQCTWKTSMIHETFVRWALYIVFKFVKSLIRHLGLATGNVRCVWWFSWTLFVHHFVAIGEFKLELQSGNAQPRSNSTIFRAVWPSNLMDDLEKQYGTSSKQHQAICIISSSYVNSNWSYSPETVKLVCDLCDLDLWPLTLTFCMDLTLAIGNNSWKFHDDTMMGT